MACNCTRVVGLIVLMIVLVACGVSFVAPYWINSGGVVNSGLIGSCAGDLDINNIEESLGSSNCIWFSDNNFEWEKNLEDWHYACQALFAFGILLILIAIPCAFVSVCCDAKGGVTRSTGIILMIAGLSMAISLVVYGCIVDRDLDITPFIDNLLGKFNWGYYVGIGGVVACFIDGGLFLCAHQRNAKA